MALKAKERTGLSAAKPTADHTAEWLRKLSVKRKDIDVLLLNPHGGINPDTGEYVTPGKRSPKWDENPPVHNKNIYYEGVGSRQINKLILEACQYLGISITIVNDTWKDTPIHEKRTMVKTLIDTGEITPDKCFAMEAHSNGTKEMQGKAYGFEFFTYPGYTSSDIFAGILGQEFEKEFPTMKHRRYKPGEEKEARFGILKIDTKYKIPMVLSENGFMDREAFCTEYLMTEAGRMRIARFHTKAIVRFINEHF